MKKIISAVLVCMLLACMLFSLASCGKTLSGEFKNSKKVGGLTIDVATYNFSGNEFALNVIGIFEIEGTYSIEKNDDGEWEITFAIPEGEENADKAEDYTGTFSFNEGSDDDGKYIEIGGVKYYKQ